MGLQLSEVVCTLLSASPQCQSNAAHSKRPLYLVAQYTLGVVDLRAHGLLVILLYLHGV